MNDRPEQPPEGRLIANAQKRAKLSNRKAADKAGLSEGHWRAIVSGSRSISKDVRVPVHAPADTLARMAHVVGVTPEQLEEVDRADAAGELREIGQHEESTEEPLSYSELASRYADLERLVLELLPPEARRQWEAQHGRSEKRGSG